MENVLVSVAVITYNSSKYVLETLESIKNQTYRTIELIISDDCSTDNTMQICKNWCEQNRERFVRIKLVETERNTGISANCNRAEDACEGIWVKLIAGDDLLLPNGIADCVNYVQTHDNVVYLFGKVKFIGDEKKIEQFVKEKIFNYDFFEKNVEEQLNTLLTDGNCIPAASSFYNLSFVRYAHIRYDERIPLLEDLPRWITLLRKKVRFSYLNQETVCYRVGHESSLSTRDMSIHYFESCRLYEFYYKFQNLYDDNHVKAIMNVVDYEKSMFVEMSRYKKEMKRYMNSYYSVLNSNAFKIGNIILKPMHFIKQIFCK